MSPYELKTGVRRSSYFLPTLRETPADATLVSHRLMLRGGLIRQASAGLYNWLPLGFRVLKKIERIVRQEQDRIGAHECLMPTIQSADLWRQSWRYEDYGKEMLRITDRHDRALLYGPTNEEAITSIFAETIKTYKELPQLLYHIQWKFRDEVRPRFGVMRAREFYMKDAYSFDCDKQGGIDSYNSMFISYLRTFQRLGVQAIPMRADTGPIGGESSHEFVIIAETGESTIYLDSSLLDMRWALAAQDDRKKYREMVSRATSLYAATSDEHTPLQFDKQVPRSRQIKTHGIEVGHVFFFGDKYSKPLDAKIKAASGEEVFVQMGSYGIGISRLVAAIIESSHDDRGIVWPKSVAPFKVGLICLDTGKYKVSEELYALLCNNGFETLYDDRFDVRAGVKFAEMDLLGLPIQLIVGGKSATSGSIEFKERKSDERHFVPLEQVIPFIRKQSTADSVTIFD